MKIKQLYLLYVCETAQKIIKFRYFFIALLLIGCGETTNQKDSSSSDENTDQSVTITESSAKKVIIFFGDSLTAGYQLDPEEAFPARIQEIVDSLGLKYTVINAGLSGETTSGGLNRINWILNQNADVFVLELGANDGLRGIPLNETRQNLQAMIDVVRTKNRNTEIVLAGMQIPPNLGQEYTQEFKEIFTELADENKVALIPFLLDGVAGNPELNLPDGIHPTPEGHRIVANNVWEVLEPIVKP